MLQTSPKLFESINFFTKSIQMDTSFLVIIFALIGLLVLIVSCNLISRFYNKQINTKRLSGLKWMQYLLLLCSTTLLFFVMSWGFITANAFKFTITEIRDNQLFQRDFSALFVLANELCDQYQSPTGKINICEAVTKTNSIVLENKLVSPSKMISNFSKEEHKMLVDFIELDNYLLKDSHVSLNYQTTLIALFLGIILKETHEKLKIFPYTKLEISFDDFQDSLITKINNIISKRLLPYEELIVRFLRFCPMIILLFIISVDVLSHLFFAWIVTRHHCASKIKD